MGGPAHIFFAVPSAQGYPDDVTATHETGHGGAFKQQAAVVTFLGSAYIVGVSEQVLDAAVAGTLFGLVYV